MLPIAQFFAHQVRIQPDSPTARPPRRNLQ